MVGQDFLYCWEYVFSIGRFQQELHDLSRSREGVSQPLKIVCSWSSATTATTLATKEIPSMVTGMNSIQKWRKNVGIVGQSKEIILGRTFSRRHQKVVSKVYKVTSIHFHEGPNWYLDWSTNAFPSFQSMFSACYQVFGIFTNEQPIEEKYYRFALILRLLIP